MGNLLYYRFMNPAVVAPDGFDIVDISAGVVLHPNHRRNLGSIAKILQHAAANQMFEGENSHLRVVNQYLEETHLKFRLVSKTIKWNYAKPPYTGSGHCSIKIRIVKRFSRVLGRSLSCHLLPATFRLERSRIKPETFCMQNKRSTSEPQLLPNRKAVSSSLLV